MDRLRRVSGAFSTTLIVTMLGVILFSSPANALLVGEPTLFGGTFSRQDEVYEINKLVARRAATVKAEAKITSEILEKKTTLAEEVQQLKSQVAGLDDMFVKIDKYASDSLGNSYAWGNCTFWVKSKRPDIGNFWGNANRWYSSAESQGWNVGSKAKKGAVATTQSGFYGHVAYVEGVSLDGEWITISEMNAPILNNVTTRSAHYTEFKYIYELN